jgi:hypothetical protein
MTEKEPTKLTLAFKLEALRRFALGQDNAPAIPPRPRSGAGEAHL